MPKLGEAFVVIRAALGPLKSGLSAAKSAVTKAMSAITGTIKKMVSFTYKWVKRAMLAVSAAIMGSVYAFSRFGEQMANVSTMLDDHTMRYMPRYSKAIKKMAVDFGEGTATLSKGLYDILSASIAPAKALDVLTVAAKAAKAGLTTTAVAADAITTILNAYSLSADKATNVSDILFATVKRGKLTFYELAQSVGKVAATAAVAGLSFEQVSAAIATMTRAGLNAFLATTALRSIMSGFLKPMESAKEEAKKLGIELNSTTLKTIGLTGVLEKLKDASPELLAKLIPNRRALAGFAAMIKNTTGQLFDLNLMMNSAGLTQKAYEKMTSTLKFKLDKLKQSFVILATTIGGTLAPAFDLLTDVTISSTKKAIEYLDKHKFEVMRWAIVVATRINFVRGVMQDFIVGTVKNWPETWRWMSAVATNQLSAIWESFNISIGSALESATKLFIAFGKSLYHIFEKMFMDIGASIGTWIFNANQIRKARDAVTKVLLEQKGLRIGIGGIPFGPGSLEELKAAGKEARKRATEIVGEYGPETAGFERREAYIAPWDSVIKKIGKELTPALEFANKKLKELRDKFAEIQDFYMKGAFTSAPKWMKEAYRQRMIDMLKQEKDLLDKINKLERDAGRIIAGTGGPTGGLSGRGGAPGAPGIAGGGKVGFTGFREAWSSLAQSLQPKDKTQENILKVNRDMYNELQEQTDLLDDLDMGMTT